MKYLIDRIKATPNIEFLPHTQLTQLRRRQRDAERAH
jgi:hypothetical protein